ncbi:cytochrome c-type biogenesis protein [Calderihabitans maritimus]|uniref:Cytochrome c-type biogenesis protein n=1 Tax=Calderihabitans maritimus TaxID=1246530 RepID=A0A1Z5HWK5_9FIRM|nr:cytochrome c-type biogenesis protein CcmH [Calderihabitans maritimus]GAW93737.1 hypothetical protein Flexsi_0593 [Calderihabitans maritimus]
MRLRVNRRILVLWVTIFLLIPLTTQGWAAGVVDEELFKKIEANLMCTDGCGMYLKACDNYTAQQMREEIRQKLAEGMSEEEIYGYMISIYGEEVMAAPPPNVPFNITAWVTPFLAILGGGLVIYLALDKWVFYREQNRQAEEELDEIEAAEYEEILNEEMKKYY